MKYALEARRILRSVHQRATPGRIALLETLSSAIQPLSAKAISEKMRVTFDQATLYRALEALTQAGVVRRVDFQHDHAHYELVVGKTHHHHLICEKCGTVEDIEDCGAEKLTKEILTTSRNFASIKNHSLEFYGLCNKCFKK